jgi:5-(carboxyamino)imidazole ribonucleotide synthase
VDVSDSSIVNPVDKSSSGVSLRDAITEAKCLTVEFEHVPLGLLNDAQQSGKLVPEMAAIRVGADRVLEKRLLEKLHVGNCQHQIITHINQLDAVVEALGERLILKASLDGYDGYGQWRLTDKKDLSALKKQLEDLDLAAVPLVVEKMLNFDRELSVIGARAPDGKIVVYPIAENLHHDGQLHVSIAPATRLTSELNQQAKQIFDTIAQALNYVGVLAIEMFQIGNELLVNEIAPRVHNSGHWSIQGAKTSQFENHLRAVTELPLGATDAVGVSAMVNIIGCGSIAKDLLSVPGTHLQWYGKSVRPKRKMGHINVNAKTYSELAERLALLKPHLPIEHFPKLNEEIARLNSLVE